MITTEDINKALRRIERINELDEAYGLNDTPKDRTSGMVTFADIENFIAWSHAREELDKEFEEEDKNEYQILRGGEESEEALKEQEELRKARQ